MNICILKESLCIGGTERSAANTSKILQDEYNLCLALYDGEQIKYSYGGELIDFRTPPQKSFLGKILNTFLRDIKLRRLLRRKSIDVLYTFTAISNRQTRYNYKGTAKIISARDFGAMKSRHAEYRLALNNSDAMICNSEYTRNYYLSIYPDDKDKVYAVYNYINIEDICAQSNEAIEEEYVKFLGGHPHSIVSVGRFCKEKGFEHLIKAFAIARESTPELGLVLIGDGDCKDKYLTLIEKFGIAEHVYFTGFQQNPYKYMAKCTCFVLSSLSEGFPNVLAEAMALGLPVIAVNCLSGPAEILRSDADYNAVSDKYAECDFGIITPRLLENDNEKAVLELSLAITALFSNPQMMTHYSNMSRQKVKDFSKQAARERLSCIFNELQNRRVSK